MQTSSFFVWKRQFKDTTVHSSLLAKTPVDSRNANRRLKNLALPKERDQKIQLPLQVLAIDSLLRRTSCQKQGQTCQSHNMQS
ncbi:hypothetical protein QQP08_019378 [Theobroma cacao]|nr:hypothetical protein QQP08_019378 [Theobroma cacao]